MSDHTPIEDVADAVHDLAENAVKSTVVTGVKWFHRVEHFLELVLFTGRWLLAENQDSGTVVVFAIDAATGRLTPTGQSVEVPAPVCAVFVPIK